MSATPQGQLICPPTPTGVVTVLDGAGGAVTAAADGTVTLPAGKSTPAKVGVVTAADGAGTAAADGTGAATAAADGAGVATAAADGAGVGNCAGVGMPADGAGVMTRAAGAVVRGRRAPGGGLRRTRGINPAGGGV